MNLNSPFAIEIPRRALTCCGCQKPFIGGEEYHTALVEGSDELPLERKDFCLDCWKKDTNKHSETKSTWKSIVPKKKEESDLPKQKDERALYLLKESIALNTDAGNEEAFILALYLARKRIIALRQEVLIENSRKCLIYEHLDTEEMLCVPKIPLDQLAIQRIQTELAKKFKI